MSLILCQTVYILMRVEMNLLRHYKGPQEGNRVSSGSTTVQSGHKHPRHDLLSIGLRMHHHCKEAAAHHQQ